MAGYLIYSFDWDLFDDLTTNAKSKLPAAIAAVLGKPKVAKALHLPGELPQTPAALAKLIGATFRDPEWYVKKSHEERHLRHRLWSALLFSKQLKPIGLSATPEWKPFYEGGGFEMAAILAGQAELDKTRMKREGRPKELAAREAEFKNSPHEELRAIFEALEYPISAVHAKSHGMYVARDY